MDFELGFIDHVALRVKDMETSAQWYEQVLGLKRHPMPEWGEVPLFLLSGKFGIALFPANTSDPAQDPKSKNTRIDHFAFHVTPENFIKAQKHYESLKLEFNIQDHHYFESLYTKDPDGQTVELTCLKVRPEDFYNT